MDPMRMYLFVHFTSFSFQHVVEHPDLGLIGGLPGPMPNWKKQKCNSKIGSFPQVGIENKKSLSSHQETSNF